MELDLDIFDDLQLPLESSKDEEVDEETNELGFKPMVPNAIAKEIDASITSHMPLEYKLRKITIAKPDYSGVISKSHISMTRIQNDPRLRKFADSIKATKKASPSPEVVTPKPKEEPTPNAAEQNVFSCPFIGRSLSEFSARKTSQNHWKKSSCIYHMIKA